MFAVERHTPDFQHPSKPFMDPPNVLTASSKHSDLVMKDLLLAVPTATVDVTALWSCSSHSIDNPWRGNTRKRDFKRHTSQPFMDTQGAPTPSSKNYGLATKDLPLFVVVLLIFQRRLLSLQHFQARFRPAVSTCRAEGRDEPFVIKLVPEAHSDMIWREFYMYEVVLTECFLVPRFHGLFQRPAGGWFAFYLGDVGDNLEKCMAWTGRSSTRQSPPPPCTLPTTTTAGDPSTALLSRPAHRLHAADAIATSVITNGFDIGYRNLEVDGYREYRRRCARDYRLTRHAGHYWRQVAGGTALGLILKDDRQLLSAREPVHYVTSVSGRHITVTEGEFDATRIQWRQLVQSAKQLHSLGILHGDLQPRNVAEISEGFKFFDFGRKELHRCQQARYIGTPLPISQEDAVADILITIIIEKVN
ncbi:hypothetical protein ARMGADRAFT_1035410 [Armillaria gallica]|uniref:Protein kinase domain-containing protein n=1 Tax=Armillaria gallica TaxID=47427 RepID=A0A2H3D6T2_ARMGA|nr:hypothetical protein ARMGADRAFT_1035410 [Armillaria gallica]